MHLKETKEAALANTMRGCLFLVATILATCDAYLTGQGITELERGVLIGLWSLLPVIVFASRQFPNLPKYLQEVVLVLEPVFVGFCVHITGGSHSPYIPVALLLALLSTIDRNRQAAFKVAAYSVITIGAVFIGIYYKFLIKIDERDLELPAYPYLLLQIAGIALGLFLITLSADYLKKRLSQSEKMVNDSIVALAENCSRNQKLLDEIPEGIIITDQFGSITGWNKEGGKLFNLYDSSYIGENIASLMHDAISENDRLCLYTDESEKERQVTIKNGSKSKIYTAIKKKVIPDQSYPSILYLFKDDEHLRSLEEQLRLMQKMAELLSGKYVANETMQYTTPLHEFVGQSEKMQEVFRLIERVSKSDATVIINGESGVGKELVAKSIHLASNRSKKPFITVNCGAIPENLLESELFGYNRGAFTGAVSDKKGLFLEADGGTLFLDEIGEMPLLLQVKLLRVLQERILRPVGSTTDIPVNVRILTATNRDLSVEVKEGRFREDLYYRLNVISILVPPLRDRKEDLPLLVHYILENLCQGKEVPTLSPATMQLLIAYNYPGNVRELENILERAVVLGGEVILPEHLPEVVRVCNVDLSFSLSSESQISKEENPPKAEVLSTEVLSIENLNIPVSLDDLLNSVEKKYLLAALEKTGGAKKKAAELLGINFRSFRYRLQKLGLDAGEN